MSPPLLNSYHWRQNELRHFAPKGLSDILLTSKGENKAFPPPSHVLLLELPI